jgi:hypothetical protein
MSASQKPGSPPARKGVRVRVRVRVMVTVRVRVRV